MLWVAVLLYNGSYAQTVFDQKKIENAMVRAMEWQEAHPIFEMDTRDWTCGAYYTGVSRAHKSTRNQVFLAALKMAGHYNNWEPYKRLHHADDIIISYSYLYANTIRKRIVDLKPTHEFIQHHLYEPNAFTNGSDTTLMKILWWWCDALFMAPPVIAYYAEQTNDNSLLDAMHEQYKQTYDLLYDQEEHLFARDTRFLWDGVDDIKEENGKKVFWGRGNGWVLGGLALVLDHMPKDYEHREFYEQLYREMVAKLKELQHKDGLWRPSLLSPESYSFGEVSGSGFYTFAIAWGINNGLLEKDEYLRVAIDAWKGLQKCQQKSGKVGWVQNIGAEPNNATSESWQNFGTGAFLLAGSEVIKLKK